MKRIEITQDALERVCRMYRTNDDAARAIGITPTSFARIARRMGVETPYHRKRRIKKEFERQQQETVPCKKAKAT